MGLNHKGVEEMAVWNVQQVTDWGCAYFAASSTTNPVKATGGAASNTSFNVLQAQAIDTKYKFMGAYSDVSSKILSLSVTGQTLRAVVQFKSTGNTARECKSVALLSDNNVIAILSSNDVMFTIPASSTSVVGVSVDFNIVFTNAGQATVDVSTANTAMQSDLDRLVSCHVAGDAQSGEAQTIRGQKTFTDRATFNSLVVAEKGLTSRKDLNITRMNVLDNDSSVLGFLGNGGGGKVVLSMEKRAPIFISSANSAVNISGASINITAPSGSVNITAQSGSVNVDGRLLPVQEYSYLGDSDHVWYYAHINELTAEEVSANAYLGAATQIKSNRVNGIYLSDSSGANMSSISPSTLSDIIANKAFGLVGDDSRVGVGEICYIDLTRGLEDVRNVSFTIPRGTTVGTGVTFSASSNTFHLRALRQGSSPLLADTYRFVILSSAVMPAVGASQTVNNVRTTVLAACVNGN